jgi:3-oxoacyl-[acyl-carrier protein] reductase
MKDIVLIIGASSDIGIGLIKSLDNECLILAHYNNSDIELRHLAESGNVKMVMLKADLTIESEILSMLEEIEGKYGLPNKIIHLAAPRVENIRFKDVIWDDYERDINIGLRSSFLILKKFLPKLAKERRGKVVLMLSSYVLGVPPKALSHYIVGKYAMLGLVRSLSNEYSDKNIQINSISPSMIETKFLDSINEKFVEIAAYNHPLKRNAKTYDVIPMIKMLVSKESDYINGVNIPITGGSMY